MGLSPDSRYAYAQALIEPSAPAAPQRKTGRAARRALLRSAWAWTAVGGLVVAIVFALVFVLTRPRSEPTLARTAATLPVARDASGKVIVAAATSVPSVPLRTVDLFPCVDPDRDKIAGKWRAEGGALMSDASRRARLGIRYAVPREYDFRVQFTQVDGNNCVVQMFTAGNPAALVLGGWNRTVSGFQQINGKWANINATGVRKLKWENGRMHTSVVRVRKNSIEAWLDGKLITSYATDGSDLSNRDWEVPGYEIGLGSELSSTIFHKIELVEFGPPAAEPAP